MFDALGMKEKAELLGNENVVVLEYNGIGDNGPKSYKTYMADIVPKNGAYFAYILPDYVLQLRVGPTADGWIVKK